MFHIGKVKYVIKADKKSADSSVQAAVKMWDDNLIILDVDKKISAAIKPDDFVLADYTPMAAESINRKMVITKILDEKKGREIYLDFSKEFERKKEMIKTQPVSNPMPYIR